MRFFRTSVETLAQKLFYKSVILSGFKRPVLRGALFLEKVAIWRTLAHGCLVASVLGAGRVSVAWTTGAENGQVKSLQEKIKEHIGKSRSRQE